MVDITHVLSGIELVLQPVPLLLIVAGVLVGIIVGSIPGMTATMTVAILVSFTFGMSPVEGLMLLLGIYGGALYAGSIPAILIRTPGTPSAAATVFDGYPLSQQGEAGRAIGIATISSVIGGIISVLVLALLSPQIAAFALQFGSPEFFALTFFGITIIATISSGSVAKGLLSGLLGMFLSTVGLDPMYGYGRFTIVSEFRVGFDFIAIMIGLFGLTEGLFKYYEGTSGEETKQQMENILPSWSDIRYTLSTSLGSSVVGTLIGSLPGAGGSMASFVTYNEAKRWTKNAITDFGSGNLRGVAAAEAGNNSSTGGALIPTLTLGIPGDGVSAILIGALMVHGIRPGPGLYQNEPELVYAIFFGFALVYVAILIFGLIGARFWARLLNFPTDVLWPFIFVLCVVGTFALNNTLFDVWVMIGAGVLGYVMRSNGYPLIPLVLGLVLAPIIEENLRRSLQLSSGSPDIFLTSPIALVVLLFSLVTLLSPLLQLSLNRFSA